MKVGGFFYFIMGKQIDAIVFMTVEDKFAPFGGPILMCLLAKRMV